MSLLTEREPTTRLRLGLAFVVVLLILPATAILAQLAPGGTFVDDDGNPHEPNIEAVAAQGITNGCNPPIGDRYCPHDSVTRAQMAAFLLRSIGVDPTGAVFAGTFSDVEAGAWYAAWVEELASRGITTGYEDGTYRPNQPVSRAEMAALLLRTLGESPAQPIGLFSDVPVNSWYAGHVEAMYQLGITKGCGSDPLRYCPFDSVQRDELASFLARALGLDPIVPPPPTTTTSTPSTTTGPTTSTTVPPSGGSLDADWFLVDFGFSTYACHDDPFDFNFDQYECWTYYGSLPTFLFSPDLYCSGPDWSLECDPRWYPDELDELYTLGSTDYICNGSYSSYADWGDLDCVEYTGGDPTWVSTAYPDVFCSPAYLGSYDCNSSYYPSEMDGRFFATISYSTYVCEPTWQGDECHGPYYSGHPEAVIGWTPDYYCNSRGCSPYDYP